MLVFRHQRPGMAALIVSRYHLVPQLKGKISVGLRGAVRKGGRLLVASPATIRTGLDAAGGLAATTRQMRPAGIVSVRRKQDGRYVEIAKFDMSATPAEWEHFELQDGDSLIFGWHVKANED